MRPHIPIRIGLLVALIALLVPGSAGAQEQEYVRTSQKGSVSQTVNTTEITVEYSRPLARGRTLFGSDGLEKWGKHWTPGANEATTVTFSKDVRVQGRELAAGEYTLWTVPGPREWKVVFSSATDVWHLPYPEGQEVLEVAAHPMEGSPMEALTFYFPQVGPDDATMVIHWGETVVPLLIQVKRELPVRGGA